MVVPALFAFLALNILGYLVEKNLEDSTVRAASQALVGALSIILLALGAVELFKDWYSGMLSEKLAVSLRLFGTAWVVKKIAVSLILAMASLNIYARSRRNGQLQRILVMLISLPLILEVTVPTPIVTPGWETKIVPSWSWVCMLTFLLGSLLCLWIIVRWKLIPEIRS